MTGTAPTTPTPSSTTLITTPTFARHAPDPWEILASAGAGPLRPSKDAAKAKQRETTAPATRA